jgi:predicted NodU family carbamoyl transferase
MDKLIDIKEDGTFRLNMQYFNYCTGLTMTNSRFDRLFEGPPRKPESAITQKEMDIAASIQKVTEEIVLRIVRTVAEETQHKNLCLAGGVALNSARVHSRSSGYNPPPAMQGVRSAPPWLSGTSWTAASGASMATIA